MTITKRPSHSCTHAHNCAFVHTHIHPHTLIYIMLGMRPSMRKITQQSVMLKNLRIGEAKQNMHREREREREAQRISLYS